jgi:hypothetical protein
MLIFAIFSIPAVFILLEEKITSKKIVIFVWGVLISSIISTIMWSIGTLYNYNSDTIITKSIKAFIVQVSPLLILFYNILYRHLSKNNLKKVSSAFVCGFLYWNLLFTLFLDDRFTSNLNTIILPMFFIVAIYFYDLMKKVEFAIKDRTLKAIVIAVLPFCFFIFYILSSISKSLSFSFLVLVVLSSLTVKINLFKMKDKIFK